LNWYCSCILVSLAPPPLEESIAPPPDLSLTVIGSWQLFYISDHLFPPVVVVVEFNVTMLLKLPSVPPCAHKLFGVRYLSAPSRSCSLWLPVREGFFEASSGAFFLGRARFWRFFFSTPSILSPARTLSETPTFVQPPRLSFPCQHPLIWPPEALYLRVFRDWFNFPLPFVPCHLPPPGLAFRRSFLSAARLVFIHLLMVVARLLAPHRFLRPFPFT